jgi:hypothetical protein
VDETSAQARANSGTRAPWTEWYAARFRGQMKSRAGGYAGTAFSQELPHSH